MREMFVLVGFDGRKLGVPLSQLQPVAPEGGAREAMEDWRGCRWGTGFETWGTER
ncbi:MAG: hypothetical protein HYU75_06745 [Betaproteobacteria bacterium]|nr:hypothetical protein [Betaproteobacteria bacterium]